MKTLKAITSGFLVWVIIFVEWSIIIFTPGLKDLVEWQQYIIHYVLLIPIVIFGVSFYYKSHDKVNGLFLGLVMLATGIILDSIITVPLFTKPEGVGHMDFFFFPLMLIGMAEFVFISWFYWLKKVK